MRLWSSRRGGSGVDEEGGRLRRPARRCATVCMTMSYASASWQVSPLLHEEGEGDAALGGRRGAGTGGWPAQVSFSVNIWPCTRNIWLFRKYLAGS